MYTENTVESFVFISLESLIVVFNFFPFLYFRIFRAHTCTASPLISVMCAKNFCPFICLLICCNIEFVWTMLGLCCKMEVARTSGLQSAISSWPLVDLCRILVGGSLLVPCSLPGPPVVSVFSSLLPGKGGWSWASQSWLEVNYLGRLVHRYGRRQWHPTPGKSQGWRSLVGCSPWGG